MLRPLMAFGAIAVAAFLLAPTVVSVHETFEELDVKRDFAIDLWKWGQEVRPPDSILPPICDDEEFSLYSEVTDWPERIRKNATFEFGGIVNVPEQGDRGIAGVEVDLFLNETKELPGEFMGTVITDENGRFRLEGHFPADMQATKYHLVAHAHQKREGCIRYLEHWSDPEMELLSQTKLSLELDEFAIIGRETRVRGRLIDDVGGPVRGAEIDLRIGDEYVHATTADDGSFVYTFTPTKQGEFAVEADFDSTDYYDGSVAKGALRVLGEHVQLDGATGQGFRTVRGEPLTFSGRVFLKEGATPSATRVTLDGVRAIACEGCEPTSTFTVEPDETGNFSLPLTIPSSEPLGEFGIRFDQGGLEESVEYDGTLLSRVTLHLEAKPTGFFDKAYRVEARAVDDAGNTAPGSLDVFGPDGWHHASADTGGVVAYSAESPCGPQQVRAHYNGTRHHLPVTRAADANVCPYMAFVPPFLLAMPWWGWLLLALASVVLYEAARRLRERYATVITRGPPIDIDFTEPRDAAAGIVGVGEVATVTAVLENPLPDGHTLQLGTFRDMKQVEPGDDLRVSYAITPDKLGELPVRAEILDKRGRVVTRRTAVLRVVAYGEEIERRHLILRRERLGDKSNRVTPREFQAWLRERAPHLDPEVTSRLIGIFEEADYGPREARRAELVAYLEAENALPEVSQHAVA